MKEKIEKASCGCPYTKFCMSVSCGFLCIASCLGDFINLIARFWMANIFWKAGQTKIQDWNKTVDLFANEYKVPVLPPETAAFLGTGVELVAPILLVIGLFSRAAAIPMLVMTGVIEFTYMHYEEHIYWAILLGLIICKGLANSRLTTCW